MQVQRVVTQVLVVLPEETKASWVGKKDQKQETVKQMFRTEMFLFVVGVCQGHNSAADKENCRLESFPLHRSEGER